MHILLRAAVLLILRSALAGNAPVGSSCNATNNHLDAATHKFLSDCDETAYCTSNGTCATRGCRRDEWPFGYAEDAVLPPMCGPGTYCPDAGDACRGWVAVGSVCEMNRDDECAPPALAPIDLTAQAPLNSLPANATRCLVQKCVYANVTLGAPCVVDNTVYIGYGPNGQAFTSTVSRDNCRQGLYCLTDAASGVQECQRVEDLGAECQYDRECGSGNCGRGGACEVLPETPNEVPAWQYGMTIFSGVVLLMTTCVALTILHRKNRMKRYMEIQEYWIEQSNLRSAIITLHTAAEKRRLVAEKEKEDDYCR